MSIASTQQAIGYVGFTESADNCGACGQSRQVDTGTSMAARAPGQIGLRCAYGGFFTVRRATCRRFEHQPAAPAATARIQIGPTDI